MNAPTRDTHVLSAWMPNTHSNQYRTQCEPLCSGVVSRHVIVPFDPAQLQYHTVYTMYLSRNCVQMWTVSNAQSFEIFFFSFSSRKFPVAQRQAYKGNSAPSSCRRYWVYRVWPMPSQIYRHSRTKRVWPKIWSSWHRCPNYVTSRSWLATHVNRCAR